MIKKLILITLLLYGSNAYSAISDEQLNSALGKYCISIPGDTGPSGYNRLVCGGVLESYYKSGQTCSCYNTEYLTYDPVLRRCKPKCPKGFFVNNISKTGKCAKGQYKKRIERK